MNLNGKAALVTGGGTGAGREVSLKLAGRGAAVAVNYSRSEREAQEVVTAIRAQGGQAVAVQADVSLDAQVRRMVERVCHELGGLDMLINNAGTTAFVPLDDLEGMQEDDWDRIMAVNLKGAFFCARAVAPHIKARGGGTIVNVASIAGISGRGSSIAYCASKGGLLTLTRSLAIALAPEIRVNAVAPGLIDTRWLSGRDTSSVAADLPLRRIASPADIADAVVFLATDAAFSTGSTFVADGGHLL